MNQQFLQADIRRLTGTSLSLNGDWNALFDYAAVPPGSFNQRLWSWIDGQLAASHATLTDALDAYAKVHGLGSWSQVTDIIAPSALPGLIAWWDARSLSGLMDGALVETLEDQKGVSDLAASGDGRPTLRDGGNHPAGRPYLEFDGSATIFSMAQKTPSLDGFTLAWTAADDRDSEFNFLFADSDAGDMLGLQHGDKVYFRGNWVTVLSGDLPRRRPALMAVYVFVHDGAAYRLYVNGELWAEAEADTVFAFDHIGGRPSSGQFWTGALGEALLFDRPLGSDEREMVETYLSPWRVRAVHVDADTGDDAWRGWTADCPWQSLARANDALALLPGDSVLLRRGRTWREGLVPSASGEAGAPIVFGAYGEGSPPLICRSAAISGGWSPVTGTEYARTMAAPVNVFWRDGDEVHKLVRAAGSAGALAPGQWDHDSDDLHVNIGRPVDGEAFEIPLNADEGGGSGVSISGQTDVEVTGLCVRFCLGNGIEMLGALRPAATDCEASFNGNDGFNIHESSDFLLSRTLSHRNGQGRTTEGAAGDGYSAHQDSDGLIEDAVATDNEKGGFLHQRPVTVTHRRFRARGNNINVLIDHQGTPAVDGFTRWENGVVEKTADDAPIAAHLLYPAELHHVTIAGEGGGTGIRANAKASVRNCMVAGFETGIAAAEGIAPDACYSLLWANDADRGAGVAAGLGDVEGDPLLVDQAGGDLRPCEGSPAIGAGRAGVLSEHRDAAGNPIVSRGPVTIGAYQYPVRRREG